MGVCLLSSMPATILARWVRWSCGETAGGLGVGELEGEDEGEDEESERGEGT